jgi:exodeoxyribonuclease-5
MTTNTLTLPASSGDIILTEEQAEALSCIQDWLDDGGDEFRLGGYAGTGKTTMLRHLVQSVDKRPIVCAFTGKACSVLRKKGIPASTIHSVIYEPADPDSRNHEWRLKPIHKLDGDFFIVDEASMISRELYEDMKSFLVPILFVGDPGQLEPVGDNPNLMADPDFVLQTIHRQAAENPILRLASDVRGGAGIPLGVREKQLVTTTWPAPVTNMLMADQIIVGANATRRNWNQVIRAEKGFKGGPICVGEKVIVLRNCRENQLFNGQILFVDSVNYENDTTWDVNARDEQGLRFDRLKLWKKGFEGKTPNSDDRLPKRAVFADYGYVITCHKAQGSEWDNVIVFDCGQSALWDVRRWRYTAITRAAKALIYALSSR